MLSNAFPDSSKFTDVIRFVAVVAVVWLIVAAFDAKNPCENADFRRVPAVPVRWLVLGNVCTLS